MAQANEARNKGTMDKANEGAQTVGKTVNETFENVKHRTQEAMHQAGDRATQMAGQASDKVQAWAGQAFDSTSESMKGFGKEVTEVVRKYPLPALLVGFGVGLLCGRLMKM